MLFVSTLFAICTHPRDHIPYENTTHETLPPTKITYICNSDYTHPRDWTLYSTLLHTMRSAILTFLAQFLLSWPVSLQIPHFLIVRILLTVIPVLPPCSGDAERDRVAAWDRWLLATISKWDGSRRVLVRWLIAKRLRPKAPTGRPRVLILWRFWISNIPLGSVKVYLNVDS